ncbi:MAG: beta-ketoacyl-ACP synthase II [Firmicutes bacterium]|jgi:3-oxoacyl-[acyl-carrier-protein] synthase II|nr:beta-ketoacyl-ACP synthase II [Bacillota bacterium]
MRNRVVITGMGAVTPVGLDLESTWESLVAGRSGVGPVTRFDCAGYDTTIAAEVKDFDPTAFIDRREAKRMDRFTQLAVASAAMALAHAGLDHGSPCADPGRAGVSFGTGIGGMETFDQQFRVLIEKGPSRVSPFFIPMMISNMAAGNIAMRFGFKGPNVTLTTACCASAHSVGDAFEIIRRGDADVMVAGGSEAPITPIAFAGFCAMKAMSTRNDEPSRAVRPFDARRDGFVMGEGGGAVVLESLEHAQARGARVLAEVVGYGQSADAYHITAPPPDGEGAARAMESALRDAGMAPEEIDYINAHGTSTPLNDKTETLAIKRVFGDHAWKLAVSSTKSVTGHLLGAAGIVELIACVKAIETDTLPPTINYEEADPDCDLDYVPNVARKATVRAAMSNSFGFGGQNVSLIVKRPV